jgi:molybdenum cofactor cytidylyltransferase
LNPPAIPNPSNVAGIILAAGESSRMGRDKALLPLGPQTFIEHIAAVLSGEVEPLLVVLGYHAAEIQRQAQLPQECRVLQNPDYRSGQLSSLKVAVRALASEQVSGALICLVDHPAVSKAVVHTLLDRFRKTNAAILVPTFEGRRGHPVLFVSRLFEELEAAPLDEGARWVVHRHAAEVELVAVDEEGILWDVDRPEDYEAFERKRSSLKG